MMLIIIISVKSYGNIVKYDIVITLSLFLSLFM